MPTRNGDNTSLDNAEIVWDEDDPGGKTMRIRYPEPDYDQEAMAAVKEKMDRLLYENYRQDAKGDATALAKPSELDAVTPHKVLTAGQKRELQAMKAASDLVDLVNKPVEWALGKANDVTGGAVYGVLGNPYVMAVMNTLTPSKWIGAAQTGYMPWDERNTGIQPGFEGVDLEELSGYDLSHIYNNLFDTGAAFIPVAGVAGKVRQGLSGIRNARIARRVKSISPDSYPTLQKERFEKGKKKGYYTGDYEVPTVYIDLSGNNWSNWKGYIDSYKKQLDDLSKDYSDKLDKLMEDESIPIDRKNIIKNLLLKEQENKAKDIRNFEIDQISKALERQFGRLSFTKGLGGDSMDGFTPQNFSAKDTYNYIAEDIIKDSDGKHHVIAWSDNPSGVNVLVSKGDDAARAAKQMKDIVESHEILHHIHDAKKGIDPSLPKPLAESLERYLDKEGYDSSSGFWRYLTGNNHTEISDRASQARNYLGKKFGDKVTEDELLYAADHYVKDLGFDNNMSFFFGWIKEMTKEERKVFLSQYMNNPNRVLGIIPPIAGGGLGLWAGSRLFGSGSDEGVEGIEWE